MPREYAPEDNPWGDYTRSTTWQDAVRAGDMVRLGQTPLAVSRATSYNRRQNEMMWYLESMDTFIGWAHVDFTRTNNICIIDRLQVEKFWIEIQNEIKSNFIRFEALDPDGAPLSLEGCGGNYIISPDGETWRYEYSYKDNSYGFSCSWPNLSRITTIEEMDEGCSLLELKETNVSNYNLLKPYVDNLLSQETGGVEKIKDVFSTPLQFTTPQGIEVKGLIFADNYIQQKIQTEVVVGDIDFNYDFFLIPSQRYSRNKIKDVILASWPADEPTNTVTYNQFFEYCVTQLQTDAVFIESLETAVMTLNNQISTYIDDFSNDSKLSFSNISDTYLKKLKPTYCRSDVTTDLGTLTGSNAVAALRVILELREVLELGNLNFIGSTNTEIPLAWSYPISKLDVADIFYPDNNRATNLLTIHQTQIEVPEVLLTLEELDELERIFTAIKALQLRLPDLEKRILQSKSNLEKNRAQLSALQDTENIRLKVNAAAQAARAQTRERIARDIENRERNIESELRNLEIRQTEKQELIEQYLNE